MKTQTHKILKGTLTTLSRVSCRGEITSAGRRLTGISTTFKACVIGEGCRKFKTQEFDFDGLILSDTIGCEIEIHLEKDSSHIVEVKDIKNKRLYSAAFCL